MERVAVCTAQVPFMRGGAEVLADALVSELKVRGFDPVLVQLPFKWYPIDGIMSHAIAWRLVDLTESDGRRIDRVICTKFPSYGVKHPNKVTWLVHQHRPAYDLFGGELSDFRDDPEGRKVRDAIMAYDTRTLSESRYVYAISDNVAKRLRQYNGLESVTLYPPPQFVGRYDCKTSEGYILYVGRLDALKRIDLLLDALALGQSRVQCIIAGEGKQRRMLESKAKELGITDRVKFVGFVDDDSVIRYYAHAAAVYYAPLDEDYGYATIEAMLSGKPVITTHDAGGVLEFVRDQETGLVGTSDPRSVADMIDYAATHPAEMAAFGRRAQKFVQGLSWDNTIAELMKP